MYVRVGQPAGALHETGSLLACRMQCDLPGALVNEAAPKVNYFCWKCTCGEQAAVFGLPLSMTRAHSKGKSMPTLVPSGPDELIWLHSGEH